jgi:hypothetical protein
MDILQQRDTGKLGTRSEFSKEYYKNEQEQLESERSEQ